MQKLRSFKGHEKDLLCLRVDLWPDPCDPGRALDWEGGDQIFRETINGSEFERPELAEAMVALPVGDVFVIDRLDQLDRYTFDLL